MRASRPGRVGVAWDVRDRPLSDRAVRAAVRAALAHGGRAKIDVEVAFVSDRRLAAIHGRFLGDPSITDVISFDLEGSEGGAAGEIYVSVDRAREVARERGSTAAEELRLYLVHGALHLCGFDDLSPADRSRMRAAEALVLSRLRPRKSSRRGTRSPRPYRKTGKTARA
jgi:probable rRNA maturation factor